MNGSGGVGDPRVSACCIVGGGPAGAVLALLLARGGVPVTLLERHSDFDRDFRGDTIHASVMQVLDELGLAERLLQLPHSKIRSVSVHTPAGSVAIADFKRLKTRFPYIVMIPQVRFLEFITAEAARYPGFQLVMGARVQELIEGDGVVRGVRYRGASGMHEVLAPLTVGTDGRFSVMRRLAGMERAAISPPVDVLWFRLPRERGDAQATGAVYLRSGHVAILLDRGGEWQNVLVEPLREGQHIEARHLAKVQRRREWPTRVIQTIQAAALRQVVAPALDAKTPFRLPLPLRLLPRIPFVRDLPGRMVAFGIRPARVQNARILDRPPVHPGLDSPSTNPGDVHAS
jgi:2-polyprenyl-6-methoxyphenol hydroxylase-like FAD-dependent oxidoreductase